MAKLDICDPTIDSRQKAPHIPHRLSGILARKPLAVKVSN